MEFLQHGVTTHEQANNPPQGVGEFWTPIDDTPAAVEVINDRAVRWIVLAGDVLEPEFSRTVPEMRMGGENLGDSCRTLKRASNGFLRRCQLTPMTLGADYVNNVHEDEDKSVYKTKTGLVYNPKTGTRAPFLTYYREALPGVELRGLLQGQQGANNLFDTGIREVEALYDPTAIEPNTPQFNEALKRGLEYQHKIFPEWRQYLSGKTEFFKKTDDLHAYLVNRRDELSSDTVAVSIIDTIIASNQQFARYVDSQLSKMQKQIEAGRAVGDVFSWTQRQVRWFDMCGLTREEFLQKKADLPNAAPIISREEFEAQGQKLDKLTDAITAIAPAVGKLAEIEVGRNTAKETPVETKTAEATEKSCASLNGQSEPCKGAVTKEIDGKSYCRVHPKE